MSELIHSAVDSEPPAMRCGICRELIDTDCTVCPECGEVPHAPSLPPGAVRDSGVRKGWLRMHWRPLLTMTVLGGVFASGIALRHLAPNRYEPPRKMNPTAAAAAVCDSPCWHGEACQVGRCVWAPPNGADHLPERLNVAGPFPLPKDVVDVLPLDAERFAASHLLGVQIHNARTGAVMSLVSDAPHAHQMARVGDTIYASAPKRVYVLDVETTRVLKTIELDNQVSEFAVGASGQRVLASIPGGRAVAVIATDYHAEVDRFFFGDAKVGPVAIDDTGERALTTNGYVPLPGLKASIRSTYFGTMYAFDPGRLSSEQDRVRTSMQGNPVDLLMAPDSRSSYVLLREKNHIVPVERLESGAVRLAEPIPTCEQPEEIVLVRRGRRAIVRCNVGHAIDVIDLDTRQLLHRVPLNARVNDIVVTPDGRQAVFTLPRDGAGAVGVLNLDEYTVSLSELGAEPHRVRIAPDGRMAVVISDSSKAVWVIR